MEKAVSEYEKIRLKNAEDNKLFLSKLMQDLKEITPVHEKKIRTKRLKVFSVERRNPCRVARFNTSYSSYFARRSDLDTGFGSLPSCSSSPPQSISESSLSSDQTFSTSDDSNSNLSNLPWNMRQKKEKVTQEELEQVALSVSQKRFCKERGTTCHQCRQKTMDTKTICSSKTCFGVKGQFCGPCLRNRYGEDAREALLNESWLCPPCRGICNCSFCCRRAGKRCTGILAPTAKAKGFSDVNAYLQSFQLL